MFIAVNDPSQVAEARRMIGDFASTIGLARERIDQLAIIVTELATNLVKHGSGGHLHARQFDDVEGTGLELLALDRGKGMSDVSRCLRDGYSTAGSPGNGLGAIGRLADSMQVYSRPGFGSAIMARILLQQRSANQMAIGAALAPYPGEKACGDNWSFVDAKAGPTLLLVDGSGHGVEAARAAETAVRSFIDHAEQSCEAIVDAIHRALAATRGAAVAVARIDPVAKMVRLVGVGNISAILVQPAGARHMVSHNGTAGHVAPRIREFTYEYSSAPLVVLYSDGLATRWDITTYPGLTVQHPALIAGVLLRDHRRGRDDASVVAMRPMN
ncbi:MAG TPA: ATP-binding protein [Acetobacteraceae bacterium]|nr:ATP-binding protein [Acetobacteraceae bacterium]